MTPSFYGGCSCLNPNNIDVLILGSGGGGKLTAWHMARSGRRIAVVERRWIGGSCPNVACLPSKNEIRSAEVAHLARARRAFRHDDGPGQGRHGEGSPTQARHGRQAPSPRICSNYKASGAELIMGTRALRRAENARSEPQ